MVAHRRAADINRPWSPLTSIGSVHMRNHHRYAPVHGSLTLPGATQKMIIRRTWMAVLAGSTFALASCQTAPPPILRPAAFTPLGVSAPYLSGDVIGGHRTRAAKMRAAKIRPIPPAMAGAYMARLDRELRQQT